MSFFADNLAALHPVSPGLATLLENTPILPGFVATPGTDQSSTFARVHPGPPRHIEWLGGTSMPRASAEHLIAALDVSSGANGMGLSIGTGYEWRALLQKLAPVQMLFVYEPLVANVRMALEICDLAQALQSRRLVLLAGTPQEATGEMIAFLERHPGIEPPAMLHPLPTLGAERRHALLAEGETIVRAAVLQRQLHMAAVAGDLARAIGRQVEAKTWPVSPQQWQGATVVGLTCVARYPGERPLHAHLHRLNGGAVAVDRHDAIGPLLHLQILVRAAENGPVRIASDLLRGQLPGIPAAVPVETWVPPAPAPGYFARLPAAGSVLPGDRIIVHHESHADALRGRGFPAGHVEFRRAVPPAISAAVPQAALAVSESGTLGLRHRVALIAEFPASDMESLNLVLPTHQAIYRAACDIIAAESLAMHPGMAADVYRRALSRAGVESGQRDKALEDAIMPLILEVLIPAMVPLTLVTQWVSQGLSLALIGSWPGVESRIAAAGPERVKRIDFGMYAASAWQDVAVLAHVSVTGSVSPLLFDALAADVVVAAAEHATDRFRGSLPTLLAPEKQFARCAPAQLIQAIKSLLRDAPRRQKFAAAAREAVSGIA